jgi:outer membrane protein
LIAALAATVLVTQAAFAQAPVARSASTPIAGGVAIVDMTYIFEKYSGFQSKKDALQKDISLAEQELKSMQQAMQALAERLKDYKPNTPDFNAIEEELAKKNAEGQVRMQKQKKEFLGREAKMFYSIYQEVSEEIKTFAERNGINLVLRFTGDPVDVDDPQQVVKELNKGVVYYSASIDITPHILEQLNRRQPRTAQPVVPTARPAARPAAPRPR